MIVEENIYKGNPFYHYNEPLAFQKESSNGDAGEKMPLLNTIMKKYEQEAQMKIAEAQQMKKEELDSKYDSSSDGGEVLHDPTQDIDSNGSIDLEGNGNGFDASLEDNGGSFSNEEVIKTKNKVEELCKYLEKANEALEDLNQNSRIIKNAGSSEKKKLRI